MREGRQLVPLAVLFGKVIAYQCTACSRTFSVSLLYGAVPWDYLPPQAVRDAFSRHGCKKRSTQK